MGIEVGSLPDELFISNALVPVENGHGAVPVLNVGCVDVSFEPQTWHGSLRTVYQR